MPPAHTARTEPASKSDLAALAQTNAAPEEVIQALQAADAEQFDDPTRCRER